MPPFLRFLIRRLLSIPVTLLIVTAVLYGFVMMSPPEVRASLFIPAGLYDALEKGRITQKAFDAYQERVIESHHLRDPFPVQYAIWLSYIGQGELGYSSVLREEVLARILRRMPVTLELTLYSLLLFIPLGLASGVIAGSRRNKAADNRFRLAAFLATTMPPFVLAIMMLAVFYVTLHWFAPERLSVQSDQAVRFGEFTTYTGFLTIDGLINGRTDIALEALRHLVMPVTTLSLLHWATLGRMTRVTMVEEIGKDYYLAGRARGVPERALVWKHAFRNALAPAVTSSALSAASLVTGVFVVERIFNFRGVSEIALSTAQGIPDAPTLLGFAIYSTLMVLLIMLALDILQAIFDPRVRAEVLAA